MRVVNIIYSLIIISIVVALGGYVLTREASPPILEPSPMPTSTQIQVVKDSSGLISFEIPNAWKITTTEGAKGVQLAFIAAESLDWKYHQNENEPLPCATQYYEKGGQLTVHIIQGAEITPHLGEGGEPGTGVTKTENIMIDGRSGVMHEFLEPCTMQGKLVDAHVVYKGNNYNFRLAYDPTSFSNAQREFKKILSSINFLK